MKSLRLKETSRFGDYYARRLIHAGEKSLVMEAARMYSDNTVAIKLYTKSYDRLAKKIEKKYNLPSEAETGLMLNPGDEAHADSFLVATLGAGIEYGKRSGSRYIVQEFVHGVTIKRLISCEDLRVKKHMNQWARQICLALQEIHSQKLVYRDMCSDNIMICNACGTNRVKLIDLGFIAPRDIAFEEKAGTPAYMAPEQVAGQPLSNKADIYSLGVVFFEMLTGALPYNAEIPGDSDLARKERQRRLMIQHLEAPPPRLPPQHARSNPVLARIIDRCLRKKTEERYDNVREITEALTN